MIGCDAIQDGRSAAAFLPFCVSGLALSFDTPRLARLFRIRLGE
jgi:hypothetical protein